jgi:DNA-binding NtrC family response regulator
MSVVELIPRLRRSASFRLRIERGAGPRTELLSGADRVCIGSSPEAELVIEDNTVSPLHCEIVREQDHYVLRDLQSEHGTWVGGVRVREAILPQEAYIDVGAASISFAPVSNAEAPSLHPDKRFGGLIGESAAMRTVFARLARVADRGTTVLLEGESGTGKELAARAIHEQSARRDGPFVVVDCGSISRTLIESELFGHERGAYTGAMQARPGAFVRAHGGSVFLDEVSELDLDLQPRLLGVLERREVMPIGGSQPIPVDVRIIAATNRDLLRRVTMGAFREDLYYRLAVARIRLPPLSERVGDIPLLAHHFMREHAAREKVTSVVPTRELMRRLARQRWPGNVRELRNVVEQILAFGMDELPSAQAEGESSAASQTPFKVAKEQVVRRFERQYLTAVLAEHGGNITAAAAASQVDRVHFLRLLDRHGLRSRPPPR